MTRIAAIGFGNRAGGMVANMLELDAATRLVAVVDPDVSAVRERLAKLRIPVDAVEFLRSVGDLIQRRDDFDGVVIGTRCHLHADIATKLSATGLPLFLEKPVATSWEQLEMLREAFQDPEDRVVVSFPLRYTPLFRQVLDIVGSGRLGTINQIQAVNNVPYGGVYFGQWYRNYDETGGLWLQKATHDFDYINLLAESSPTAIASVTTQRVYGGDMPHDLRCSECDRTDTCPESPINLTIRGDDGGMYMGVDDKTDHWCAFSEDIKNQDSGSALIIYQNGLHASYSQNFVSRRSAYRRGAVVTGYDATLEFDWATESIRVIDHHRDRVDNIEIRSAAGHSGGDYFLAKNFLDVVKRRTRPAADLQQGILSAAMCLCARTSSQSHTFEWIPSFERERQTSATGIKGL